MKTRAGVYSIVPLVLLAVVANGYSSVVVEASEAGKRKLSRKNALRRNTVENHHGNGEKPQPSNNFEKADSSDESRELSRDFYSSYFYSSYEAVQNGRSALQEVNDCFSKAGTTHLGKKQTLGSKHQKLVAAAYKARDQNLHELEDFCDHYPRECAAKREEMQAFHDAELTNLANTLDSETNANLEIYLLALSECELLAIHALADMEWTMKTYWNQQETIGEILTETKEVERQIKTELDNARRVLFRDMCFAFVGALGEVPEPEMHAFNTAMQTAFELALMEKGIDMRLLGLNIVEQTYTTRYDYFYDDRRRRLSSYRRALLVRAGLAFLCNCKTDTALSDVDYRALGGVPGEDIGSLLSEGRHLSSSSLSDLYEEAMKNFASAMREVVGGVLGEVESVDTFPCSENPIDEMEDYLPVSTSSSSQVLEETTSQEVTQETSVNEAALVDWNWGGSGDGSNSGD